MNGKSRILAIAGLLALPLAAAPPAQAQQITVDRFLEVCPDTHATDCPDIARTFVATRTPGAETDEDIRTLAYRLENRAEQPYVNLPICKDMAFGVSILADAAADYRLEREVRKISGNLCSGDEDQEVASTSNGDDDEDEQPTGPF